MSSYDFSATLGLDGSGLTAEVNKMTGAVGRFARQLDKQFAQLQGGAVGLNTYRAGLLSMDGAQRAVVETLLKRDAAERKRQEAAKAAAEADKRRAAALQQNLDGLQREAAAIGKTAAQLKIMELRSLGATQAQLKQAQQMQSLIDAHRRLQQAGGTSGGISPVGAVAAVGGAAGIIKMADAWTTLQNRLKLVHGTQAQVLAAQQGISAIARETGQDITEVGTVYQRFAANQKELNLNSKELVEITETVSKAISVGGSSAEGAAAALNQFGQALASGVLRGEEFNSVMEQAPGLAQALARGLGVSIGQLRNMANNGELTAKTVVKALQSAGAQVRTDFAKTTMTIGESFQVLQNKATEFIGKSGESSGAVRVFSGSLLLLADHLDKVALAAGAIGAVSLLRWSVSGAAGMVQMGAAVLATGRASVGATAAQTALSASVARVGTVSALASYQVTGFSGALAVLRTGATAAAARMPLLWAAFGAGTAPVWAAGAAIASVGVAINSLRKLAKGEDAANVISRGFDWALQKIGVLKNDTDTLGGAFYDLLHPIDEMSGKLDASRLRLLKMVPVVGQLVSAWQFFNKKNNKQDNLTEERAQARAVSGWQSLSKGIADQGGFAAYQAKNATSKELHKSISETVLKYQEQAAAIGKTKDQMALLTLAAQKEELLRKKRAELADELKHEKPADREKLIKASLAKTAAELDADIKSVSAAMKKAEDAAKSKAAADKAAAAAAEKRREVEDTVKGLQRQVAELGKSADEVARMRLAAAGATQAELAKTQSMQEVIRQYEKQAGVMKSLQDLQQQLERVGKSAAEIKLLDLRDAGATAAQLAQAKSLLDAIAVKEAAQQRIGAAGDKMLGAAETMRQAADKIGNSGGSAAAWLAQRRAEINAENARRDAEINAAQQRRRQAQGGFSDEWWSVFAQRKYGHEHYQATPEYKALTARQTAAATAQTQAASVLTQAGTQLGQAAGSLNQAAAKLTTPAAEQTAQAQTQGQFPAAQGFQAADMGRIVLDLRYPNGKTLSGILFGTKEFLAQLKAQTEANVRDMLLGVRDAVR